MGLAFGVARAFQQLLLLGVIGGLSRSTGSVGASGLQRPGRFQPPA